MASCLFTYLRHQIWSKAGISSVSFLFAVYLDDLPSVRSLIHRSFVVLYADDILLIAPSISELQQLLHNSEKSFHG